MRRAEMRSKETDGGSCKNEPVLHPPVSKVTPGKPSPPPPAITGTQRTEDASEREPTLPARHRQPPGPPSVTPHLGPDIFAMEIPARACDLQPAA